MRREGHKLVDARGTLYACVPFYIAEEYGFSKEKSRITYDRTNPKVLILRIENKGAGHE